MSISKQILEHPSFHAFGALTDIVYLSLAREQKNGINVPENFPEVEIPKHIKSSVGEKKDLMECYCDILKKGTMAKDVRAISVEDYSDKKGGGKGFKNFVINDRVGRPIFVIQIEKGENWQKGSMGVAKAIISQLKFVSTPAERIAYAVEAYGISESHKIGASNHISYPKHDAKDFLKEQKQFVEQLSLAQYKLFKDFVPFKEKHVNRVTDATVTALIGFKEYLAASNPEIANEWNFSRKNLAVTYLASISHDMGRVYLLNEALKPEDELKPEFRKLKFEIRKICNLLGKEGHPTFHTVTDEMVDDVAVTYAMQENNRKHENPKVVSDYLHAEEFLADKAYKEGDEEEYNRIIMGPLKQGYKSYYGRIVEILKGFNDEHIAIHEKFTRSELLSGFRPAAFHHVAYDTKGMPSYMAGTGQRSPSERKHVDDNTSIYHTTLALFDRVDLNMNAYKNPARSTLFAISAAETSPQFRSMHEDTVKTFVATGVFQKTLSSVYGAEENFLNKYDKDKMSMILNEDGSVRAQDKVEIIFEEKKLQTEERKSLFSLRDGIEVYQRYYRDDGNSGGMGNILEYENLEEFVKSKVRDVNKSKIEDFIKENVFGEVSHERGASRKGWVALGKSSDKIDLLKKDFGEWKDKFSVNPESSIER